MAEIATDKVVDIVRQRDVVRPRALAAYGIRRDYLADLQQIRSLVKQEVDLANGVD